MLLDEGLVNVFTLQHRIAEGIRHSIRAWRSDLCAADPSAYSDSDTVSTILTPADFNATDIVADAEEKYGVAFGEGLGEVAGKVFRIGHLGSLTDVMDPTAEMCTVDLGINITMGSGVAAAQKYYSGNSSVSHNDVR